ncbi:Pentatricopeptide repeat [Melia azedarach]|uniref:Pentatricopeptide repeat n=1 Tax=Melia azedarach TaxID=155640 RepID=A0ACC1XQI5_MELAZ|nr:Pentatricopeptide repeat [Melia azedarach]
MQVRPSVSLKRPLYIWNLMIRNSTNNGCFTETLNTYSSMLQTGVHGNSFTFPLVLKACANINSICDGKKVHSHVLQMGFQQDAFVQTGLVDMYSKCCDLESSKKVFDEMPIRMRSVVSWNSMIAAYSRASLIDEAILVLKEMWVLGVELNASTFVSIFSGCSFKQGLSMHCCVYKLGLLNGEIPLSNSIMSMYIKFGRVNEARCIFDDMNGSSIISWTTIIGGYVNVGNANEAFGLFNEMRRRNVKLDLVVFVNLILGYAQEGNLLLASSVHSLVLKSGCNAEDSIDNSLVNMYIKCGDLESARRVFDTVDKKSVFLWTSMIGGYTQLGYPAGALNLFKRLLGTSVRPNEATLATVLSACADLGSLSAGKEIEEYILLNGFEFYRQVQTSMIHMFSKCGSINKAKEVFDRVTEKDLAVWSAMINGYAIHGMGEDAINLFHKMQLIGGVKPDAVVYTSILLACSHSGFVDDGLRFSKSMKNDFGIEPTIEHYICLVDLLGRAGRFDLALKTIEDMPSQVQAQVWAPLLSACRKYHNIELGEFAARRLFTSNPGSTGNYVLMANLYSSVGMWKEAAASRGLMTDRRLIKEPGWSQVEINGSVHVFVAGDRSHHLSIDIYKTLEELTNKLLETGYFAETEIFS